VKVLLFANTAWYLYNFRRSLALALKDAGHDVLLVSPPGPHGEKLRGLGLRWEEAPMKRLSLNPWRELGLVLWLRRLMLTERVDLVHAFTIKCAVYGSIAARLARLPARINAVAGMGYVFSSNDLRARLLRPVVRALMRFALDGHGARLILQNGDDVQMFIRAGLVNEHRVRLIPGSGVDCERFAPGDAVRQPGAFRVLLPARLLWDKGVREYVEAARELRGTGREIRFMLAGEPDPGNPASVPEAEVTRWAADGTIEWLGHVDDMPALFRSVDAVVLPSYREGLPKGLIEAAASGLPLVSTDVPGCRDVISDGVDGLLVPARDAAALAQAIGRLHDDTGLRARLGAAARRKARARFDEQLIIRETLAVYRELMASARTTASSPRPAPEPASGACQLLDHKTPGGERVAGRIGADGAQQGDRQKGKE
jgi:glycosyltransferase involved in cell wall biosynthesis